MPRPSTPSWTPPPTRNTWRARPNSPPMTTRSVPVPAREASTPTDTSPGPPPAPEAPRPPTPFPRRQIGPDEAEVKEMLRVLGYSSLEDLIVATVPDGIRLRRDLRLPEPRSEERRG